MTVVAAIALLPAQGAAEPDARNTVVWISIDGMRHDYVDRADTPTIDKMAGAGVFTRAMVPVFPSLTFPNHVSQITGVPVAKHGISANSFYDNRNQRSYRFPPWENLLESEPLWQTATRQGIRTAVTDWPMGHAQRGEYAAAYFQPRFDTRLSDRERLENILAVWENDDGEEPLQLIIGWIGEPDTVGHSHGPNSDELIDTVEQTDALLAWFIPKARALWERTAREGDQLYFVFSTDHGMSEVHTLVNARLLGSVSNDIAGVEILTSGNIANIYLDQMESDDAREEVTEQFLAAGEAHDFMLAYRRDELPEHLAYAHPHRTGDVVLILDTGYTFSARPDIATAPLEEGMGPKGMHGYDPESDSDMLGYSVFYRLPTPLESREIPHIRSVQFHATVAGLLGIEPAPDADPDAVMIVEELVN